MDLTTYKKEEQYTNFYQEGEVYTPSEFLLKKGYDPKRIGNEKKQIEFLNKDPSCLQYSTLGNFRLS